MAKKDSKIKTKTLEELKKEVKDARGQLFDLRLEMSQNKLKNLRSIFFKRKEIARLLTQIRQMELIKPAVRKTENENI